jgi:hypothetical protein
MYLDIPASANLDEPCMATFKEEGPARPLSAIRLWRDGVWVWCAITGWDESGPVPAWIQVIEESGDGPAQLVHGGPLGLRLRVLDQEAPWSTNDQRQWGEPFLLVTPEAEWR